jgi:signal transduction histidine kinase
VSEQIRDLAEQRRRAAADDALRVALARTERLARVGELAGSVAHEIRNPLCGMLLSIEVLQGRLGGDDSCRALLQNLRHEVERMERIVSNLLHFARDYQPMARRCSIGGVVREALQSLDAPLARKGMQVEMSGLDNCEAEVDAKLVQQVFCNIVLNAIDAAPRGGRLAVSLAVRPAADQVAVSFRDDGQGMDRETLGRIFEPFFTHKAKGAGLGLAVSKKIVEAHGGAMEVVSEPGRGSTFTVVLPRCQTRGTKACAGC